MKLLVQRVCAPSCCGIQRRIADSPGSIRPSGRKLPGLGILLSRQLDQANCQRPDESVRSPAWPLQHVANFSSAALSREAPL